MTVYRTDDNARWGAGKGSNLTPAEVDLNFWGVIQRISRRPSASTPSRSPATR